MTPPFESAACSPLIVTVIVMEWTIIIINWGFKLRQSVCDNSPSKQWYLIIRAKGVFWPQSSNIDMHLGPIISGWYIFKFIEVSLVTINCYSQWINDIFTHSQYIFENQNLGEEDVESKVFLDHFDNHSGCLWRCFELPNALQESRASSSQQIRGLWTASGSSQCL